MPALEGVRGLAVLLVVLSHMSSSDVSFDRYVNFRGLGNYGVYLFFVLSAFLLTRQFLERPPSPVTSPRYWGLYALRRVFRIYPLYVIALVTAALWPLASFAIAGPKEPSILRHLLLLDGQKILWTIPVEMKFYALLPAILVTMHLVTRSKPWLAVVFLLAFATVAAIVVPPVAVPKLSHALKDYLSLFLFGMTAAAAWQWLGPRPLPLAVRLGADVAAICLLLAVVAPAVLGSPFGPAHALFTRWLGSTVAWFGGVWSLFVLTTLGGFLLRRVFELRPLRMLGVASFSAYLWHMVVIEYLRHVLPPTPEMAFVILATVILVSVLSYRLLERPWIAMSARWSHRPLDAAASRA